MEILSYYQDKRQNFLKERNPLLYDLLEKNLQKYIKEPNEDYIRRNSMKSNKKEALQEYHSYVKQIIYSLFEHFFLQYLPLEIWKQFISEDRNFENNTFIINYGMYPIQQILENEEYNEFEKERKIQILCNNLNLFYNEHNNISFKDISLDGWNFLVKDFKRLFKLHHNLSDMINLCPKKENINISYISFYSYLLEWKDIEIVNFSNYFRNNFFHPSSHFEGKDFYIMNDKKLNVKLIRDNEKVDLTPEIYENLKKLSENWKEYFFDIKWNCIKRQDVFLNLFQHLLSTIQYIKERFYDEEIHEMMKIFNTFDGTIGDILFIFHNIIIRMDNRIESSKYHYFLNQNNKYYLLKRFLQCPDNILFPESSFQSRESLDLFEKFREESFQLIKEILLEAYNPLTGEQNIPPKLLLKTFFKRLPCPNFLFYDNEKNDQIYFNLNYIHKNKTFFQEKNIMNDYYKKYSDYNYVDEYNKSIIDYINNLSFSKEK